MYIAYIQIGDWVVRTKQWGQSWARFLSNVYKHTTEWLKAKISPATGSNYFHPPHLIKELSVTKSTTKVNVCLSHIYELGQTISYIWGELMTDITESTCHTVCDSSNSKQKHLVLLLYRQQQAQCKALCFWFHVAAVSKITYNRRMGKNYGQDWELDKHVQPILSTQNAT